MTNVTSSQNVADLETDVLLIAQVRRHTYGDVTLTMWPYLLDDPAVEEDAVIGSVVSRGSQ